MLSPEDRAMVQEAKMTGLLGALGQASMPARHRMPIGAVLANAAAGMNQGQQQGIQTAMQNRLNMLKLQEMQGEFDQQKKRQAALQNMLGTLPENMRPIAEAYPDEIGKHMVSGMFPKPAKIAFAPNGTAYDENNPTTLQVGQSYAKPEDPGEKIKQYNLAKTQGYQGSFTQWIRENSRAGASVNNVNVGFPKETFKNERDLRNDFQGLPTTKAFREVQTAYDQINYALSNPSAANDLAAATKFMKLLDPGSVVRESELAMAMAATGKLDRLSNYFNMLSTGQKLTPQQRKDFYASARGLYEAASNRYNELATEFRGMAQDYQLNPDRIAKPVSVPSNQSVMDQADAILNRGK